jgi:drug/metabolite transporter, DME family
MESTPEPQPVARAAVARAYLQVILAGALWATGGPFSVILHRMGIPPESLALLRPVMGGILLLVLVLALPGPDLRPSRRDLLGMLLGGGVIVAVFQLAYQMSTATVGVPATVALLYLAPAFVVGVSPVVLGERLTPGKAGLALLSVGGVWLTVLGARGVDVDLTLAGVLWGCLCGLSYGSYTLFGKAYGRGPGPLAALFWSTVGGSILLAAAWWLRGVSVVLPDTGAGWGVLLLFALLTMAVAPLLLFHGMKTLEAGRASIGTTVEPLVAAVLAMVFLDQVLTPMGWFGMLLLVTGVSGAYALRAPRPRGHGTGRQDS